IHHGESELFIPYAALALLSLALLVCALLRVDALQRSGFNWLGCLNGLVFTVLVLSSIYGLTKWLDEPYVLSIVCMAVALVCIVAGFLTVIKPLRLYGLILVMMSVMKLAFVDVFYAESVMRVVAFIVGGLICFGINMLYNNMVKRLDERSRS
ncbi:MAG: DUF2339 domain-containing protein, partial [Eggerthellaceae bacterium]|nr:DUF2339 domain-containing protein [Eggerthellaceae bacterium]